MIISDHHIRVLPGDCREVLPTLAENSVDAVCTDPPYSLVSIQKRFGKPGSAPVRVPDVDASNCLKAAYARASAGFMGAQWDTGETAFDPAFWVEVLRVMKPGAHLLAMGGTRTYHQLAYAIEAAGFEIRDCVAWLYGSGFPKSHDVSKGIDRELGKDGSFGDFKTAEHNRTWNRDAKHEGWARPWMDDADATERYARRYIGGSEEARQWAGWGSALKPAMELVVLARKPLSEDTIAANVLRWGMGALNIDGCRIDALSWTKKDGANGSGFDRTKFVGDMGGGGNTRPYADRSSSIGRWPSNVIHDGSDEVTAAFPQSQSTPPGNIKPSPSTDAIYGKFADRSLNGHTDQGSTSRFFYSARPDAANGRDSQPSADRRYTEEGATNFAALPGMRREPVEANRIYYTAKADADDRLGSKHPTIKPLDLIQYLIRLITPKGGLVLDPFAGSGTTGEAAYREGMRAVLIEREPAYVADIERRLKLMQAGPYERERESLKARGKLDYELGPLFERRDADERS
jgi:site-specific DNA-methyltransferase (adenine-specific)